MKKLFYIISLILFCSCENDREIFSRESIKMLSDGNYEIPSKFGSLDLFVLSDDNELIITNTDNLKYVYDFYFKQKFQTYEEFLFSVLNHKMRFDKSVFNKIKYENFKISKKIESDYRRFNFGDFFNKYTLKRESIKGAYKINVAGLNHCEIRTISYFFYLNGYDTSFDDNSPKYIVRRREMVFGDL